MDIAKRDGGKYKPILFIELLRKYKSLEKLIEQVNSQLLILTAEENE